MDINAYCVVLYKMIISIDANIGAGKTTILNRLSREFNIDVFLEPVDEWTSILDKYYNNKSRWGLTLNLTVLNSFNKMYNNINKEVSLFERSQLSCKYIFMKSGIDNGLFTPEEINVFDYYFNIINKNPDVIIYIKTDPEVAFNRIIKRGRECESSIELEYIKDIDDKYNDFISKISKSINTVIIDGNRDHDSVYNDIVTFLKDFCPIYFS